MHDDDAYVLGLRVYIMALFVLLHGGSGVLFFAPMIIAAAGETSRLYEPAVH